MQIDKNYRIEKDEYSWNLIFEEERIASTGKKKGQTVLSRKVYYHTNITNCLMDYISHKVDPENKTAEQILEQLNDIKETITNLLNKQI